MGIAEKIICAKEADWLTEGISKTEIKTTVELAKISGKIERRRLEMGMTQAEFADYMCVTQGMVSKWESRGYNFTIRSLNEICEKLELDLFVSIEKPRIANYSNVVKWEREKVVCNGKKKRWSGYTEGKEAIA